MTIRIPTIERYLARQIYAAVGFVLLGFLALFALFDLIAELRDLGNGQLPAAPDLHRGGAVDAGACLRPGADRGADRHALRAGAPVEQLRVHGDARSGPVAARAPAGCSPRSGWCSSSLTFAIGEWIAPCQRAGGAAGAHARHAVADRRRLPLGALVQGRAIVHQRARGARCGPAAAACGSTSSTRPTGCARSPRPSAASTPATATGAWCAWRRRCSGRAGRRSRTTPRPIGARR